jgi:hypothetical protein
VKRGTPRRLVGLALVAVCAAAASVRAGSEKFTATASVKRGGASASAPLTVVITKYAGEDEIARVRTAATKGGAGALSKTLSAMEDTGFIQLGDRKTAIKLAASRATGSGRLITVLTSEPMFFLGAGMPAAKPMAGFDVAIAMLVVEGTKGTGELAPAAKVGIDSEGAIVIEDYGATVVWLADVASAG